VNVDISNYFGRRKWGVLRGMRGILMGKMNRSYNYFRFDFMTIPGHSAPPLKYQF